jgi:hypothetical protein
LPKKWGFPSMMYAKWLFILENPNLKWMI